MEVRFNFDSLIIFSQLQSQKFQKLVFRYISNERPCYINQFQMSPHHSGNKVNFSIDYISTICFSSIEFFKANRSKLKVGIFHAKNGYSSKKIL